jgi:hypothetical protein
MATSLRMCLVSLAVHLAVIKATTTGLFVCDL